MNIKEIVVTPAMAKALLLKNTNNRTLREHQTRYLARELERDAWITNLDPIAVSTEGVLLNGQHRLSAIVRANKAAKVLFTDDADPSVFPVTDRGLGRTVADATGLTNGLVADAVLIAYFLTGDRARIPVDKIQDIVEWWKPTHDALQEAARTRNVLCLSNASVRLGFGLRWAVEAAPANRKYVLDQYGAMILGEPDRLSKATFKTWQKLMGRRAGRGSVGTKTERMMLACDVFFAMRPGHADKDPYSTRMDQRMDEMADWLSRTEEAYLAAPKGDHPYLYGRQKLAPKPVIIAGSDDAPAEAAVATKRGVGRPQKQIDLTAN